MIFKIQYSISFLKAKTFLLVFVFVCVCNFTVSFFVDMCIYLHRYVHPEKSTSVQFSSVHFSRSVVSNSLHPHELQHASPPCPSPTPRVHSNSCSLSQWCHPAISSSVVPFSFCLQSFPASESFQLSQFFASGGQSIGASASTSVLPMNIQGWFPLGWTAWISLLFNGLSRVFYITMVQNHQFLALSFLYSTTLTSIHDYWKNHTFD